MTTNDPVSRTPAPRPRRGSLAVLLAVAACSVCLLPALLTTATLTSITGWLTGASGIAITAAVLALGTGLAWLRRRNPRQQPPCQCSNCT